MKTICTKCGTPISIDTDGEETTGSFVEGEAVCDECREQYCAYCDECGDWFFIYNGQFVGGSDEFRCQKCLIEECIQSTPEKKLMQAYEETVRLRKYGCFEDGFLQLINDKYSFGIERLSDEMEMPPLKVLEYLIFKEISRRWYIAKRFEANKNLE